MVDQPYQSLYRRFRPQKFSELRGQDHVVLALRNSVRDEHVSHAYLFSGPRGTGKTSTARILAKALNCTDLSDGEPCGVCDSCIQVQSGTSLDVHELDAASNNGVDAMRDLVSRASLGSPGRWKVYIVDEVHMLSAAASNALLKTLEEPPAHVIFVLATTDPQKVLPTIRSRTQHFEFHLLSSDVLGTLLADINATASLGVANEAIDLVVKRGNGSARDALSVLDQVAAAGTTPDESEVIVDLTNALIERDAGRALLAVAEGMRTGREARRLTVDLLDHLRNAFLATMARSLVMLPDDAAERAAEQARQMGVPTLVRAMEVLGEVLIEMREAIDPRIALEVALVRIAKPEADASPAALLERIDRLERNAGSTNPGASSGKAPTGPQNRVVDASTSASTTPALPKEAARAEPLLEVDSGAPASSAATAQGVAQARAALGAVRKPSPASPTKSMAPPKAPAPKAATPPPVTDDEVATASPDRPMPTRDQLTEAWGDTVLDQLPQKAKARFRVGRFVSVENDAATFALPNEIHRDRCDEVRPEVEGALGTHFQTTIKLRLIVESETPGAMLTDEERIDLRELRDVPTSPSSAEDRVKQAFPGAEEITS